VNRDEAKLRGAALRDFLRSKLPVPGARSITALARKAGLRPNTVTSWWSKGFVPDNASLERLAGALDLELVDLIRAYNATPEPTWTFTNAELESLLDRTVEKALLRVRAEREGRSDG